jgi:hypothetical protein
MTIFLNFNLSCLLIYQFLFLYNVYSQITNVVDLNQLISCFPNNIILDLILTSTILITIIGISIYMMRNGRKIIKHIIVPVTGVVIGGSQAYLNYVKAEEIRRRSGGSGGNDNDDDDKNKKKDTKDTNTNKDTNSDKKLKFPNLYI